AEAPRQLKVTRTRSTQTVRTVGERRADAPRSQASASVRPASLPRSLVASYRRQGGGRTPPVRFLRSFESSSHTLIPLHARKHSRRGGDLSSSDRTIPGNVGYTDDARGIKSWEKLLRRLARGAASAGWRAKGEQAILAPS